MKGERVRERRAVLERRERKMLSNFWSIFIIWKIIFINYMFRYVMGFKNILKEIVILKLLLG